MGGAVDAIVSVVSVVMVKNQLWNNFDFVPIAIGIDLKSKYLSVLCQLHIIKYLLRLSSEKLQIAVTSGIMPKD